jgi:polar amino acid transport system substrate-binding protein
VRHPLSFAFLAILLFFARSALAERGLDRVHRSGVLRWGADVQGGEPYVHRDPADPSKLVGFEVEIADALAKRLGVRAEFVQNDWANLVPALERGDFDIVLNGLEVTPSRTERILFTRPYYVFSERLMARKGDARVRPDLALLAGLRVGTLTNSLAFDLLRGRCEVVPYDGVEEPYQDLVFGRLDAVLLDDVLATRYGAAKPELEVIGDVGTGAYAIGVRKDEPDLATALDGALAACAHSGELRRILERASLWNERQEHLPEQVSVSPVKTEQARLGIGQLLLFVRGAGMTLLVSTLAMLVAVPFGIALALVRSYAHRIFGHLAGAYVEIYRGTPVLLQLYVLYFGLAPVARLGPITAAVLGLGMNYAAYEAETYRGAIQSVPKGQMEAAISLGMSFRLAMRRIVLPQAFRHALPNVTNDYIALLKDSSLVSVIAVVELTKQMTITAVDVRSWVMPGILCALLYFGMSYPLSRIARRLEKKLEGEQRKAADA